MPHDMKQERTVPYCSQLTRADLEANKSRYGTMDYEHKLQGDLREFDPSLEYNRADAKKVINKAKGAIQSASADSAKKKITSLFRAVAPKRMDYDSIEGKEQLGSDPKYGGFGND